METKKNNAGCKNVGDGKGGVGGGGGRVGVWMEGIDFLNKVVSKI